MRSIGLVVPALLLLAAASAQVGPPILPDPRMTPGDVLTSDPKVICVPGYTKTVRNVPTSLKNQVYKAYSITSRKPGECEIDHLVSLELGGSNSVRNLWPESYVTKPLNAHVKDDLENKLHDLACSGKISFQEAQQAIATNWVAAYAKYVGPLPGGAKPSDYAPGGGRGAPGSGSVGAPGGSNPAGVPATPPPVPPKQGGSTASGAASVAKGAQPNTDGSCSEGAPIKVSRSGVYHLTNDPNYKATRAVACFASEAAAQAAGYRAPGR